MNSSQKNQTVHGWLVLDKPLGLTSTQALGKARRFVGGKKAGHGGTLDPLATGVLPIAFGEATKIIPYVMDGDKEYEFSVRWGEQRSTDDAEGEVVAASNHRPSSEDINMALPQFVGKITQTPPVYSAIKIDGERAYDIARAGGSVEMKSREVSVFSLRLISCENPDEASFHVHCGKGMYVRSLARDLAVILGTYGYVSGLRRTRVGCFGVKKAISLENLANLSDKGAAMTALLELDAALDDIPGLYLSDSEAQRLRAGQSLMIRPQHLELMSQPVILARHQGIPVALVEARAGAFCVLRGFNF
ncbi:MAG: tRNA pseudouridine(55) synthase TruB [Alphaproteobacteria bacterium]|nr:tRNA pseudouridine(55) synthase TruB [Alphaproteobacteria bacterium]